MKYVGVGVSVWICVYVDTRWGEREVGSNH